MPPKKEEILLIAHRGAKNLAPENTLKAFQKAIELKADYVEFDVHGTKDGEIVIMHDGDAFRTTGHKGKIKEMTLDELKKLDCGEGEKIPTLQELIDLAKGKIGLQLEVKAKGLSQKIVDMLREANMIESTIISSFIHKELNQIRKIDPNVKLGTLIIGLQKNKTISSALKNGYNAIHPVYKLINNKFVEAAHKNNLKVNVWTVDDPSDLQKMIEFGVDGIITNDLETAKKVLGRT